MLRISFVALLAILLSAVPSLCEEWGHLSGTFVLDGDAPKPKPLLITKDPAFCGKQNLVDESIVVNPENKGIANIVVYLYTKGNAQVKVHESYAKDAQAKVRIDNDKCRFEPRILAVRTSQTLLIGNLDTVGHNAKIDASNAPANPIIPAGKVVEHRFPAPERLPVTVSCAIHPWMSGKLIVKDHPYMAVTDKDGKFKIENLPTGEWTFQFWHEEMGYVQNGKLDGKKFKWKKGRLEKEIKAGENEIGTAALSLKDFD